MNSKSRSRVGLLLLAGALGCAGLAWYFKSEQGYDPPAKAYSGTSNGLKRTVIVPTLDAAMPKGRNVIWCSSFQIAWNHLRQDVIKQPVQLAGAEAVAARLNRAPQSEADVAPESYYATAGFMQDGIIPKIQEDMAARFPDAPRPEIDASGTVIVAYAYLVANIKFKTPFFENRKGFLFKGSDKTETSVTSFGVRPEDGPASHGLHDQVEILYTKTSSRDTPGEFAVDPCRYTEEMQIVLALVKPKATLAKTLADLEREMDGHSSKGLLGPQDTLLVPNAFWQINHHFKELEGKYLKNRGFGNQYIAEASQMIDFRLDRSGAELKSEAKILTKGDGGDDSAPRHFIFDRPFLIYMKKRDAKHPFFVMWVDNAELLSKPS